MVQYKHRRVQIGSRGLAHRELTLIGTIAAEGRAVMVAVNKVDLLDASARQQVLLGMQTAGAGDV